MASHRIGTGEEHLAARLELLTAEKELLVAATSSPDDAANCPGYGWMVRMDKEYVFDTDNGPTTLPELFGGRSQLLVYHFMFGPEWHEGCTWPKTTAPPPKTSPHSLHQP